MNRITVLDDYQGVVSRLDATRRLDGLDAQLQVLHEPLDNDAALIDALRDTRCLVLIRERTRIGAEVIAALPKLELIVQTGRLSSCIDLDACARHGITVREGSGNPIAPAELTWALVLAASRRLVPYVRQLEAGRWQRSAERREDESLGTVLHGRTLGIWGYGRIGARVASVGRAFGMRVIAHGRGASQQAATQAGDHFVADRKAFLAQADVLSLHLRMTPETRHIVTADDLAALPPHALLVNTSRAELVAPGALLEALAAGRPGFAVLDVFEDEPGGVQAYLGHPRILCTPHLGFVERDTYEAYFDNAFGHVHAYLSAAGAS
jgi:D-3-phosphoglycerate dehydrogenase